MENRIAAHETFELHELLNLKIIGATKCSTMVALVKDEGLKTILNNNLTSSQEHIRELHELIQSSVLLNTDGENAEKGIWIFSWTQRLLSETMLLPYLKPDLLKLGKFC